MRRRRLDQPVLALAHIDVDVVDADRGMPDADLARPRRPRLERSRFEHVRTAEAARDHALGRHRLAGGRPSSGADGRRAGPAAQEGAQALEAALVDALADEVGEFLLAAARRVEGRLPVPEGAIAVGHALELDGGDVALHRQRGVEDAVGRDVVVVREREKLLADVVAVLQREVAHAADLVGRLVVLDGRFGHDRMPGGMAVEVAQDRPDALDRRIDDGGAGDPDHCWERATPWRSCCR